MHVVLIHIGDNLPDYFWLACEQVRRFFPGQIHVIIPDKYVCSNSIQRIGLNPVATEHLMNTHTYRMFNQVCFLKGFWNVTMGRLFLLEELIKTKKLEEVIHIENDVLIYTNPGNLLNEFKMVSNKAVLLTPIDNIHMSAAYMYVENHVSLSMLNSRIVQYLQRGENGLRHEIGIRDINEMILLNHIWKKYDLIKSLPITPRGKGNRSFTIFKSLFDGASYGQFLGGTDGGKNPGWISNSHWAGQLLKTNKYSFHWERLKNGCKIPYLLEHISKQNVLNWKINNLHIHSKNLRKFM